MEQELQQCKQDYFKMIKLKDLITEGKWGTKGKYLTMPGGELSSIPGNNDRDAIAVYIGRDEFKIHMLKSKPYAYGPKYDKTFKNVNDLVKWLNKNKARYIGIY